MVLKQIYKKSLIITVYVDQLCLSLFFFFFLVPLDKNVSQK